MTRSRFAVLAFALVMAGCGGGGADDASATSTTNAENPPATSTTAAAGSTTTQASSDGPSFARVTLDGETYEFTTEGAVVAQCLTDLFGIFSVQIPSPDGNAVTILALRPGTDPDVVGEVNNVRLDIGDDTWIADESHDQFQSSGGLLQPGMSQVDSITVDGNRVSGTATFFRLNSVFTGEVETATGSFEAVCTEERTS